MRALGWSLFGATCILFVLQGLFLGASDYSMMSSEVLVDHVFPLLGIGAVVGSFVGALIVSRYPRNLIGWLFLVGQLGNAIGLAATAFIVLVLQGVVDLPFAGQIASYLSDIFSTTFTVSFMSVIFMIAPDGHFLSRWWRLAVVVPVATLVFRWAAVVIQPTSTYLPGATPESTDSLMLIQFFYIASFFAMLLSISIGATALVLRLRRSTGQQRLQLRWIATGAAVLAVTFVLFALGEFVPQGAPWVLTEATCLAYIFFSVSVGVAIFRYRLYDIDVILSRAIVLGVLAVFVAVGYIGVVVAIGAVLVAVGEGGSTPYWPSLVATALVAVAFQPVRRHVLRLADQLVYGNRAAPYEALAALSRQLANSSSPEALPAAVARATGQSVGAAAVTVRLGEPADPVVRSAIWIDPHPKSGSPRTTLPTLILPVLDVGEQVGGIEITMPPGRALRTFERHLVEDVAAQAGVAFRNGLLEMELAGRVAQGEEQSLELAASRRRLVHVEDEARERLAGAIRRGVVPHLAVVETGLTDRPASGFPAMDLQPLIGEVESALAEMRIVCRGVFPALLERRGLRPALSAQLDLTHPQAQLEVDAAADRRFDRAVEAAGYLFCIEVAPTEGNSAVRLRVDNNQLVATISRQNDEQADPARLDLIAVGQHSRDRVAALDGVVSEQRTETGTAVTAVIPLIRH